MTTNLPDSFDLLSPVWTHLTHFQPVRGEGAYLYDAADTRYLDFSSGIGVTNTGHCHPHVVQAVQEQASKLIFGQMNIVVPLPTLALAETLNQVTPEAINQYFFSNSGAEAVEAAVKLARHATGKQNIIVFQGSFHGRTHQTMAMTTAKYIYRYNYQPLPGGVFVAPYPASYYFGWDEAQTTEFCMQQLDLLIKGQTAPTETAAIIIEPVLGEGGYIPAPAAFMQALREFCDLHEILLVVDEVQSGFGRTGTFFAFEQTNIVPDIIVMAKGLGSGLPISGIASKKELMAKWRPGSHGGTYGGGSAIAAAGAKAGIEVILNENLPGNAACEGERLITGLQALQQKYPVIGDVRGRGLMVATEFTQPDGQPDAATTSAVLNGCLERNMLILKCGSYENIIRWIPPLIVDNSHIDEALNIFEDALKAVE